MENYKQWRANKEREKMLTLAGVVLQEADEISMSPTEKTDKIEQLQSDIDKAKKEIKFVDDNLKNEIKPKLDILGKTKGTGAGSTTGIVRRDKENKAEDFKFSQDEKKKQEDRKKDLQKSIDNMNAEIKAVQATAIKATKEVNSPDAPKAPQAQSATPNAPTAPVI